MGNRIQQLRKEKKLTLEQLGAVIGVQKSAVAKYEKGAVENIKIENLKKMAELFDCSIDYILGLKESRAGGEMEEILLYKFRDLPPLAQQQAIDLIDELSYLYPNESAIIYDEATPIAAHDNNESPENIRKDLAKALELIAKHKGRG